MTNGRTVRICHIFLRCRLVLVVNQAIGTAMTHDNAATEIASIIDLVIIIKVLDLNIQSQFS